MEVVVGAKVVTAQRISRVCVFEHRVETNEWLCCPMLMHTGFICNFDQSDWVF